MQSSEIQHEVSVEFQATTNHGYPYRAKCSCGTWWSLTYAAEHAAQAMGDEHVAQAAAAAAIS